MELILTNDQIEFVERMGFKKISYGLDEDDEDTPALPYEYVLDIPNHPFLKEVTVTIESDIEVSCKEAKGGLTGGDHVLIIRKEFTKENLETILNYLQNK